MPVAPSTAFAHARNTCYVIRVGTCPDPIKQLIDHFDRQRDQLRSPDYNEAYIRIEFINPLMTELGWDIDNRKGNAEQYREVDCETPGEVIASR